MSTASTTSLWFARGLASGDVVEAKADTDGVLWIVRRLRWSGHMTIRVMCQRDEDALSARDSFKEFGADVEVAGHGRVACALREAELVSRQATKAASPFRYLSVIRDCTSRVTGPPRRVRRDPGRDIATTSKCTVPSTRRTRNDSSPSAG